jgi:hypothetical protein
MRLRSALVSSALWLASVEGSRLRGGVDASLPINVQTRNRKFLYTASAAPRATAPARFPVPSGAQWHYSQPVPYMNSLSVLCTALRWVPRGHARGTVCVRTVSDPSGMTRLRYTTYSCISISVISHVQIHELFYTDLVLEYDLSTRIDIDRDGSTSDLREPRPPSGADGDATVPDSSRPNYLGTTSARSHTRRGRPQT